MRCSNSSQCLRQSDCGHNESCVFEKPGCNVTGRCSDRTDQCGGAFLADTCGCDGQVVHGVCGGGSDGPINPEQLCSGGAVGDAGPAQEVDASFASDGGFPYDSGPRYEDATPQTESGAPCPAGDSSVGRGTCPGTPCPAGWICAGEVGGVAGGGGTHCVPIPPECVGSATCGCMGTCACGFAFGRPERCYDFDGGGSIGCDNGVR